MKVCRTEVRIYGCYVVFKWWKREEQTSSLYKYFKRVQHFDCRRGSSFKDQLYRKYVCYFRLVKSGYSFHVLWGKCGMNPPYPKFPGVLPFQAALATLWQV